MPTFDVEAEQVTVFRIGDAYLFRHYFDREDVFDGLREYYDPDEYRFEVPADEFETVRERLSDAFVEPVVVEDVAPYCVVTERYEEHADVLRNSVVHWERRGHLFFVMQDELSVREAVERGARPLEETEFVLGV